MYFSMLLVGPLYKFVNAAKYFVNLYEKCFLTKKIDETSGLSFIVISDNKIIPFNNENMCKTFYFHFIHNFLHSYIHSPTILKQKM